METLLFKGSVYEKGFQEMHFEDVAECITPEFERDSLGEWPRFATDESIEIACYNTAYNANLKWLKENYEEGEKFIYDETQEYENGEWINAGQNGELEIDYEKVLESLNDGEDINDIIDEIKSNSGYEDFDDNQIKIIPVTLRQIESKKIDLDSRIGLNPEEHDELLDEEGNFRFVFVGSRAWIECWQSTFQKLEPHWAKCSGNISATIFD
jgi:hypothetical protein